MVRTRLLDFHRFVSTEFCIRYGLGRAIGVGGMQGEGEQGKRRRRKRGRGGAALHEPLRL
jgi:hypothetical protein